MPANTSSNDGHQQQLEKIARIPGLSPYLAALDRILAKSSEVRSPTNGHCQNDKSSVSRLSSSGVTEVNSNPSDPIQVSCVHVNRIKSSSFRLEQVPINSSVATSVESARRKPRSSTKKGGKDSSTQPPASVEAQTSLDLQSSDGPNRTASPRQVPKRSQATSRKVISQPQSNIQKVQVYQQPDFINGQVQGSSSQLAGQMSERKFQNAGEVNGHPQSHVQVQVQKTSAAEAGHYHQIPATNGGQGESVLLPRPSQAQDILYQQPPPRSDLHGSSYSNQGSRVSSKRVQQAAGSYGHYLPGGPQAQVQNLPSELPKNTEERQRSHYVQASRLPVRSVPEYSRPVAQGPHVQVENQRHKYMTSVLPITGQPSRLYDSRFHDIQASTASYGVYVPPERHTQGHQDHTANHYQVHQQNQRMENLQMPILEPPAYQPHAAPDGVNAVPSYTAPELPVRSKRILQEYQSNMDGYNNVGQMNNHIGYAQPAQPIGPSN
ncbi:hypothetical protein HDU67_000331, partial [Dinochytrium kinnereticum]